ncbi:MAG: acyl carrier protein [Proteobacteria bacterium]|nr:acyl carrier protein [Pseudomonadota bacterium]MBU4035517.1 acyl carrier protein [Pseudomonadota bacterium]
MAVEKTVAAVVINTLGITGSRNKLDTDSPLLGAIPELDSLAVVNILTAIEEMFDIIIDDEDVSAELFATLGSLSAFIETKL